MDSRNHAGYGGSWGLGMTYEKHVLTADQFVSVIFSALALDNQRSFTITDTELDSRFQSAFKELLEFEKGNNIVSNFSFFVDPYHGDSTSFDNALYTVRDRKIVSFNNPSFQSVEIGVSDERAKSYIEKNPLPVDFVNEIVAKYFSDLN